MSLSNLNRLKIFVTMIGLFLMLSAWGLASPPGSSPDDNFHLPSIWCAKGESVATCEKAQSETAKFKVPYSVRYSQSCFAFDSNQSAGCQILSGDLSQETFVEAKTNSDFRFPNQFYIFHNYLIKNTLESSVLSFRAANILIFLTLYLMVLVMGSAKIIKIMNLGIMGTIIPLGAFFISSNNPSAWIITGSYFTSLFLIIYFTSLKKMKVYFSYAFIYISVFLGIFSRTESYVYFTLIIISSVIGFHSRENLKKSLALLPVVIILATYFLTKSTTLGITTGLPSPFDVSEREKKSINFYNISNFPDLIIGVFGGWPLSWLDTPIPSISIFFSLSIFLSLIYASLRYVKKQIALSVGLLVLALWIIPLWILNLGSNLVGENVQPRYIIPLLIAVLLFTLSSNLSLPQEQNVLSFFEKVFLFIAFNTSNFFALHATIRRFVTGNDVVSLDLSRDSEWWWSLPLTPNFTFILGVVGAGLFSSLILLETKRLKSGTF